MRYEVPMPSLGADMEKGKLMKWLVGPNDMVHKGDTLAVVETTKSTMEIENFHEGKVLELKGNIGDEIKVGEPIAVFDVEEKELLTDKFFKNIQEKKLDPSRLVLSQLMTKSKKEIPHYYLKQRVNLDTFLRELDEKNKNLSPEDRILRPLVFLKAIILALRDFKEFNAHFDGETIKIFDNINLGVVLSLKHQGVIVPAILESENLPLKKLQDKLFDLDERAQKGALKAMELNSATITVTNLGDQGVDEVFGIIFPPQVALVGLGKVHEENSSWVMDVSLSADHRVTDGLYGARFLRKISTYLENPKLLEL